MTESLTYLSEKSNTIKFWGSYRVNKILKLEFGKYEQRPDELTLYLGEERAATLLIYENEVFVKDARRISISSSSIAVQFRCGDGKVVEPQRYLIELSMVGRTICIIL